MKRLKAGVTFVAMMAVFAWLGLRNKLTPR